MLLAQAATDGFNDDSLLWLGRGTLVQVLVQGTNDTDYGPRDPDGLFCSTVILASTDTSVSDIAMVSWAGTAHT